MALLDMSVERPTGRSPLVRLGTLTALVTSGLILTHYRVAVFAACFVVAYVIYLLLVHSGIRITRLEDDGRGTKDEQPRVVSWSFVFGRLSGIGLAVGIAAL